MSHTTSLDPGQTAPLDNRHVSDTSTQCLALLTIMLLGLHVSVSQIPVGLIVVIVLIPAWWGPVGTFQFIRPILFLGIAALATGLYLASGDMGDHVISGSGRRIYIVLLLEGLAVTVATLWGRTHLPLHLVAVAYGLGDFMSAMMFTSQSWKYDLSLPVTVMVVGWLGKYKARAPAVAALIMLGTITALDRGRSFFAFCLLAACVVAWQSRSSASPRTRRWTPAVILAVAGLATYQLAIVLLTSGYLGAAAQERTVTQIETSGSLILGGRPQWSATVNLMRERPWGYGLGVVPNAHDYGLVSKGFRALNLDEDGYIRHSMLYEQFRLHSITADLWVRCGVIGLAFALLIAFAFISTVSRLVARRRCPPIVALMTILSLWYLAFEPTFSYSRDMFFALGLTLLFKSRERSPSADVS